MSKISALLVNRSFPKQSHGHQDISLRCKGSRKSCIKKFCSQEHLDSNKHHDRHYTRSLRRSRAVYEQDIDQASIRNPKVLLRYVCAGKRDPIPGVKSLNGSIETNDEEEAQILANHFQAVFTCVSSLPEVSLQSHTENAKI